MIIYGHRSSEIYSTDEGSATCDNCGEKGRTRYTFFSRHAHIFWIPFFPIGKPGVAECQACNITLKRKNLSESQKRDYDRAKSEAKAPFWKWSGLILIGLIIVASTIASKSHDADTAVNVQNPMVGDILVVKGEEQGYYSTLKVLEVTNDTAWVRLNNYEIEFRSSIDELVHDSTFSEYEIPYSFDELQELHADGELVDVLR